MSVHRTNNTELYLMLNMMQIIIIIMDIYSDENLPSDINPSNQLPKSHIKLHQIRPLSMSLNLLVSLLICNFPMAAFPSIGPIHLKSLSGPVQCKVSSKISSSTDIVQRSADYQPPIWDYDYIQSLRSEYLVHNI